VDGDKRKINKQRKDLLFSQIADSYKIIDSPTSGLFIKDFNQESLKLFNSLKGKPFISRYDHRKMQSYSVQVYAKFIFDNSDFIDSEIIDGVNVWEGSYSEKFGVE